MTITMIACIDIESGLGDENGNLLFDLPKDMKHFISSTTGKTIVMGRKTWDSLPKKPLKNRKNIVLTNSMSVGELVAYKEVDNVSVCNSIEEVLELSKTEDIFIIGGGEIYNQFMPYADELIITHVHTVSDIAVTFFPEFGIEDWKITKVVENEADDEHAFKFIFANYSRKK